MDRGHGDPLVILVPGTCQKPGSGKEPPSALGLDAICRAMPLGHCPEKRERISVMGFFSWWWACPMAMNPGLQFHWWG